jgi:hypothetical protein
VRLSGHSTVRPLRKPAEAAIVSILAVATRIHQGDDLSAGLAAAAIHIELSMRMIRCPSERRLIPCLYKVITLTSDASNLTFPHASGSV